jgi:YVTN family beta-propeller protein
MTHAVHPSTRRPAKRVPPGTPGYPRMTHDASRAKHPILRFASGFAVLGMLLAAAGAALTEEASPAAGVQPALDGNRGPFEVAFTPDGARALVTEFDEGALAVIDAASGKVLNHISTEGTQPTGVAVIPDGKLALVTNSFSGSLAFVDLEALKTTTIPLRGMPYDVVLSPDGATAYVSVSQLDHVAVVDVPGRQVTGRIPTGRRPRTLSITPDGRTLAAANLTQGSVSFLNTASKAPVGQGPTPAVNLRGVAIYPNGRLAYTVGQRAQNERPTETAVGIWSNQAFHVVPNGGANGAENIWLDFLGKDVSDPESVVFDPQMQRVFITFSGGHSVNVLGLRGAGNPQAIRGVGAHPKGLAFTPDGKEVWVANHLGNDLAVIDPASLQITRRINLGATKRKDPHLLGRFLFTSATIVKGAQFSCNSCHPDGNTDGISWKFVHVPDALGKEINRNVRSLRGEIEDTAPFRWSGHDKDLESFVQEEVAGLLQSPKLDDARLRAMVEFLKSQPLPPNPHRNADGSFTEAGLRGKTLFEGKAGCVACHNGPKSGAQRRASIGTLAEGIELDVPHLAGVYDSYPYLHDGRAKTLEEIFERHNPQKLHGKAHEVTPEELKDLLQYVREL